MPMRIVNNIVQGIKFIPAPSSCVGGRIEASLIVIHTTDGHLTKGNTVAYMQSPECIERRVSAHFFVEYDGTVIQMVETDVKANHCGESVWGGRRYCNGFSVGIEVVNPGRMTPPDANGMCYMFGDKRRKTGYSAKKYNITEVDGKWWIPFSDAQTKSVIDLCRALKEEQPNIKEIVGHFHISPGRKSDPGPLCPFDDLRLATFGSPEVHAPVASEEVKELQNRLIELGYNVGVPDGFGGPRTRKEVRYFQEQNGLPITGEFDNATVDALLSDSAKSAIAGAREEWTKKDLQQQGSTQVKSGDLIQKIGVGTQAIGAGVVVTKTIDSVVSSVDTDKIISTTEKSIDLANKMNLDLGTVTRVIFSPMVLGGLFIILFGGALFWLGLRIIEARLIAARNGQDTSKLGKV